jgi:hypothetical protein
MLRAKLNRSALNTSTEKKPNDLEDNSRLDTVSKNYS